MECYSYRVLSSLEQHYATCQGHHIDAQVANILSCTIIVCYTFSDKIKTTYTV